MQNDISQRQNEPNQLKLIYAYHQAYSQVNRLAQIRFSLVIATAVITPLIGTFLPGFRSYGAIVSISVFLLDTFFFDRRIDETRKLGARIQELFDRTLFKKTWPNHIVGEKPTNEDIQSLATEFEKSSTPERRENMKNWYPTEIEGLSHTMAVLVCQRSNCVWDTKLRNRYKQLLIWGLLSLLAAESILAITLNLTVAEFLLTFIVTSIPAVAFTWKLSNSQQSAIETSDRTRRTLDHVLDTLTAKTALDEIVETHSDHLQAELFYRRSTVSRVPQVVYDFDRTKREQEMKQAVASIIAAAKNLT